MFFVRPDTRIFEALFTQSVDPIAITTPHGGVVQLNPAWYDVLGWTVDELSAESLLHFVHFNDIPSMLQSHAQLELPRTHSIHGELRFLHKDGGWRTLEFNASSIDGNHFTIYRDISRRIQSELEALNSLDATVSAMTAAHEALSATCAAIRRESAAKSEFIAGLSHEMRTPLNAVLGFAQILQLESECPQDVELANRICASSRHLLELTEDAMDFSREDVDGVHSPQQPMTLRNVIRESMEAVTPIARAHRIDLRLRATPDVEVWANGRRVKQVLINLLSNAVKYNRTYGAVTVGCDLRDDRMRISVTDTGPGIEPDLCERLFTPFERLGQGESDIEGTGLGLAISKRLVEAMGGQIGFESTVDAGSTFWIELKLWNAESHQLAS
jgi:PAS domain S-box-containing protein